MSTNVFTAPVGICAVTGIGGIVGEDSVHHFRPPGSCTGGVAGSGIMRNDAVPAVFEPEPVSTGEDQRASRGGVGVGELKIASEQVFDVMRQEAL